MCVRILVREKIISNKIKFFIFTKKLSTENIFAEEHLSYYCKIGQANGISSNGYQSLSLLLSNIRLYIQRVI